MLAALGSGERYDRPPVWIMRQAGRYLPEYRGLKEKYSFLELVRTPELAAQVTLQPIRRFDFDAAVIFSDILVVPEAMGQPYQFKDGGGIKMEYAIQDEASVANLKTSFVRENLGYVGEAIRHVREAVGDSKAILGFAGSPWTLAGYMVEGGSSDTFPNLKALALENRPLFMQLMERVTGAVLDSLRLQIEAGADAVQIFDTWGGICPGPSYADFSLSWIRHLVQELPDTPVILYARNVGQHLLALANTGARCLSLDAGINLAQARAMLPNEVGLQGNLDPVLLNLNPVLVRSETEALMEQMKGVQNHVVNLGHGILPQARIDSVEAFVEAARNYQPVID